MHVDANGSDEHGQQRSKSRPLAAPRRLRGALAGAISRFVVGPLDVVKIRVQVQLVRLVVTTDPL